MKVWRVEHEGCTSPRSILDDAGGEYHGPAWGSNPRCTAHKFRPNFGHFGSPPERIEKHERCAVEPESFSFWWSSYEAPTAESIANWLNAGWVVGEYETSDFRHERSSQIVFVWNTSTRLRTVPWSEVGYKDDYYEDDDEYDDEIDYNEVDVTYKVLY